MSVRIAGVDDESELVDLRVEWTSELAGHPVEDDAFADVFHDWLQGEHHQRVVWLAEDDDGKPIGMLNMLVFSRMPRPVEPPAVSGSAKWGYVANVFVLERHRDSGIGAQLIEACTTYADDRGFVRLVLSPTERSIPVYERAGFATATSLMLRPGPPPV